MMPTGISRNSQPMNVTPRCRLNMSPSRQDGRLFNASTYSAPDWSALAVPIPIEPDPRRFADQIRLGHETPVTAILAVVAIVPDHQVAGRRHDDDRRGVPAIRHTRQLLGHTDI